MTRTKRGVPVLIIGIVVGLTGILAGCEGAAGETGATGADGAAGADGVPGSSGATIAIAPGAGTVEVGATLELAASTTPETETADTYTWLSSNPEVAIVDASGVVSGMAEGTAVIVATGSESHASGVAAVSVVPSTVVNAKSYENDVFPLLGTRDAWYIGGANCTACHQGAGYPGELDLRTYDGLIAGADLGTEAILEPGNWTEESILNKRLRNNRMPLGISALEPRDGPPVSSVATDHPDFSWDDASSIADTNGIVKIVEAWIDGDAPDGDFDYVDSAGDTVTKNFDAHVLPLFTNANVWAQGSSACNSFGCHTGPDGAHQLDMGSYEGIMLGSHGGEEPIIAPGDSEESTLHWRLRNNRMPFGIPSWVPRDGPHGEVFIIGQWVNEGALDN